GAVALAVPVNLPFANHRARVVSAGFERAARPRAYGCAGQPAARRAHGPQLVVDIAAGDERLPPPALASGERSGDQSFEQRSPGTARSLIEVVDRFVPAEGELPWRQKPLGDRGARCTRRI